jgi:hypothetical protein
MPKRSSSVVGRGLFFDDKETVDMYEDVIKALDAWRKSSCSATADNCVEIGTGVGIRDSKAPATHLPVSAAAWAAFLKLARRR